MFLVIANGLREVFLQPAFQFISSAAVAAFLERFESFGVESGGDENRAGLCCARAQLNGFDLGGGDVLSLVLAKFGKYSG